MGPGSRLWQAFRSRKGPSPVNAKALRPFRVGKTQSKRSTPEATAPNADGTVYGPFRALAQTGLPGPNGTLFATGTRVELTITRVGRRRPVFRARNVDTPRGVPVRGLARGVYVARWVVIDANADTRTVLTKFVEER